MPPLSLIKGALLSISVNRLLKAANFGNVRGASLKGLLPWVLVGCAIKNLANTQSDLKQFEIIYVNMKY